MDIIPLKTSRQYRAFTCLYCGSVYESRKPSPENGYCCVSCRNKAGSKYFTFPCSACGKETRCAPCRYKNGQKRTCSPECQKAWISLKQKGEKSHRWQGGKTSHVMIVRNSREYRQWRSGVYSRDNYTCFMCKCYGGKLTAHHIKPFSKHPDLRFSIENGITLCWECHKKVNGKETQYESEFCAVTGLR